MKTVLFLGAGASAAQYCSELRLREDLRNAHKKHEAFHPPIDGTFVDLAKQQGVSEFPALTQYCERCGIPRADAGMEQIFAQVYRNVRRNQGDLGALEAWHSLVVTYRKLITVSTNRLTLPKESDIPRLLDEIGWSRPGASVSIVTTNHDLVIERSTGLFSSGQSLNAPRAVNYHCFALLSNGGSYECPAIDNTGTYAILKKHMPSLEAESPPPRKAAGAFNVPLIVKLHGSFDLWYLSHSCTDPTPTAASPDEFVLYLGEHVPEVRGFVVEGNRFLHPLILPPVPRKADLFPGFFRHFTRRLDDARSLLRECHVLVVLGYSFPKADPEVTNAVFSAIENNTALRMVLVIDLSCDPALKVLNSLGSSVCVVWKRTVDELVRDRNIGSELERISRTN